ncbi:MAG: hypothetical protein R2800_04590 [Flavipsychrobacter sp.]
MLPNFRLNESTPISNAFIQKGIYDYITAVQYIKELPYGRNRDKSNLINVLGDNRGTCSTKHALLSQLAIEHERTDISLMMGIFKMDKIYAPNIGAILKQYGLDYIPEAHNYLLFNDQRIDCTTKTSQAIDFEDKLIEEIQIEPYQITDYKVNYHKAFLKKWLEENSHINLSNQELWSVREDCIKALSL